MAEIKTYAVRYHGGMFGAGNGLRAQVHLFDGNNKMIGWVDFYDDLFPLPGDQVNDNGQIVISLRQGHISGIVDMLRNEGPVYIYWQEKIKNAYIGTSQEPVGEGE